MTGESSIFFILALFALTGAVLMLSVKKVVHMVISLALTFISIAGLFVLLEAEFLAIAQVLVYGGAITIIMLFGIMLTKHDDRDETKRTGHKLYAGIGVVVLFLLILYALNTVNWTPTEVALFDENTKQLGIALFTKYVIPFELTSILLLVALVGAVILARRDEEDEAVEEGDPRD